jgi:hypothetical protein
MGAGSGKFILFYKTYMYKKLIMLRILTDWMDNQHYG